MRKRFAANFKQMIDFSLGRNRDPRCLRISSLLLIDASRSVLKEFVEDVDSRLRNAVENIPDPLTPENYENFIQGMNGIVTGLNTFFQGKLREGESLGSIIVLVESVLDILEEIKKASGLMVEQGPNKYWLFSDEQIKEKTIAFLKELEVRNIQKLLKNEKVKKALENKGKTDLLRNFNNVLREILKNIKTAENDINRKESNNVPMFDASKEYDAVKYASEEDIA